MYTNGYNKYTENTKKEDGDRKIYVFLFTLLLRSSFVTLISTDSEGQNCHIFYT